jgi:hypothetical protein
MCGNLSKPHQSFLYEFGELSRPTFKGCLQRIDISGQILWSEQISPKNYQENQRVVNLPLERGFLYILSIFEQLLEKIKWLHTSALTAPICRPSGEAHPEP